MKVAVFAEGLGEKETREIENHIRVKWDFAGLYTNREELLEDAKTRIIERRNNHFNVIEDGKFSHIIIRDSESMPQDLKKELHDFYGIEVISFKKEKRIENENKKLRESEELDVDFRDDGKYKKIIK